MSPEQRETYERIRAEVRAIAQADAEIALSLFYDLPGMLGAFPAYTVTRHPETADEYAHDTLTCPHCQQSGTPVVVDWATRWTAAEDLEPGDFARQEIRVSYDRSGDFESLNYQCEHCGRPVALPEGWTEGIL